MSGPTLVCFAVAQEAKPFRAWARGRDDIQIVLTGMGARNAERAINAGLDTFSPRLVYSCGFAGALNPSLRIADLVFDRATTPPKITAQFVTAGAQPATFHCAKSVAITAAAKTQLRQDTGADAVEMESRVIQSVCAARGVDSATLRVISDTANEDLPLDFNSLMTAEETLSGSKLALAILRSPQRIPALMRLGRNSAHAARELSRALASILAGL